MWTWVKQCNLYTFRIIDLSANIHIAYQVISGYGLESVWWTGLKLYSTGKIYVRKWSVSSCKLNAITVKYIICGNAFPSKACIFVSAKTMNRHKNIFCNKRGCTSTCYPWWINLYTYVLNHYLLVAPYHLNYRQICSLWVFFMTLKCILLVCVLSASVKRWPTFSSIFRHNRYIPINGRGHQAFW